MGLNVFSKVFAAAMLALALAGCATDTRSYEGADRGFLVASIGALYDVNFAEYMFRYRSRDHKFEGVIRFPSTLETVTGDWDFRSDVTRGVVVVTGLPPGEYEIYDYKIDLYPYGYTGPGFSIPFAIRSGEATYVGAYVARTGLTRDLLGVAQPTLPYSFLISNRQQRDLEIATGKFPEIGRAAVINAAPDPSELGSSIFVAGSAN